MDVGTPGAVGSLSKRQETGADRRQRQDWSGGRCGARAMAPQPLGQRRASQARRHPRQQPQASLAVGLGQDRHLQSKASLKSGIAIHIHQRQPRRGIEGLEPFRQAFAEAAALAGVENQCGGWLL